MLRYILSVLIVFSIATGAFAQAKKMTSKTEKELIPYYKETGAIALNSGLYFWQVRNDFFRHPRPISPVLYINPEMTVMPNITAGLIILHYRYKNDVAYEIPNQEDNNKDYNTLFPTDEAHSHIMAGLKAAYHINDIFGIGTPEKASKWDFYVSGMAGFNFIAGNAEGEPKKLRMGIGAGARFLATDKLAMYTEFGLNSYGIGTVGLSYFLR